MIFYKSAVTQVSVSYSPTLLLSSALREEWMWNVIRPSVCVFLLTWFHSVNGLLFFFHSLSFFFFLSLSLLCLFICRALSSNSLELHHQVQGDSESERDSEAQRIEVHFESLFTPLIRNNRSPVKWHVYFIGSGRIYHSTGWVSYFNLHHTFIQLNAI